MALEDGRPPKDMGKKAEMNKWLGCSVIRTRAMALASLPATVPSRPRGTAGNAAFPKKKISAFPPLDRSKSIMFTLFQNSKILNAIVGFVFVDMVNRLKSIKISSEFLLHQISMFINIFPGDTDPNITVFHNAPPPLPIPIIRTFCRSIDHASDRTIFLGFGPIWIDQEFFSTRLAMFLNHGLILYHSTVECQG